MPITFELVILLVTAVWTVSLVTPAFIARIMSPKGITWGLGNRDYEPNLPEWHGRSNRAHANMVENLSPFAIIVLVAHIAGVSNDWTQAGALAFFVFRVLHAVCYIAGLTPWRTHIFNLSLVAEGVILFQILQHAQLA